MHAGDHRPKDQCLTLGHYCDQSVNQIAATQDTQGHWAAARAWRSWASCGIVAWCCLVASAGEAWAQAFFPMEGVAGNGRFIEPPRGSMQLMKSATEAAEQERFADAVVILGDLIAREQIEVDDELSGQDFFIDSPADGRSVPVVNKSFIVEARRLLGTMPRAALETYELRYGAQARKLLTDAQATRDWNQVALIKRKFFHTEAGRDATQLLIHRTLAEGQVGWAKRLMRDLLTHPSIKDDTKRSIATLQSSLTSADTNAAAPKTNGAANASDSGKAKVDSTAEAKTESAAPAEAEYAASLAPTATETRGSVYAQVPRRTSQAKQFTYFSKPNSDGQSAGGQLPLAMLRYDVPTFAIDRQERTLQQAAAQLTSLGELPPPSWLPLRVGDYILMRNIEVLLGVDYKTGKRIWNAPLHDSEPTAPQQTDPMMQMEGLPDDESGAALLRQRVWNDLPYGRLTSDGKQAYLLGDLNQLQITAYSPLMGLQGAAPTSTHANSLIAVDLATEGKLVWQRGGDNDTDGVTADEFYLGPPLPIDGLLYVLSEVSGDIVLMCLDPATGAELWHQQLLAVESGTIENDPVRRVAGGAMAYQDGLLVCSTGAGAVVAVDLLDRSLVWGITCDRNEALMQSMIGRRDGSVADMLLRRWWDNTPMIDGNRVYVTAIESDRMFVLDLFTGEKLVRELARSQHNSRYLAGIHQGMPLLVGSDNLVCWDGKTSKNRWKSGSQWLEAGELICGLGAFGQCRNETTGNPEDAYFVPTTSNRIVAISLSSGAPLAQRKVEYPLGNLLAVDGNIISQGVTMMVVAYGQESLEPTVAAALKQNPEDAEMMILKAQLLIEQGQRDEALQWLDKARKLQPNSVEVQKLSINAMLGALREDFNTNASLLAELEQLIDEPEQQIELIKLQIRSTIAQGHAENALQKLIELSTLVADLSMINGEAKHGESDATRHVSLDAWLAARASEAFEVADDAQVAAMKQAVATHLSKASLYNLSRQQRMVAQFGKLPGGESLVQSLLKRYVDQQQWFEAERLVLATATGSLSSLESFEAWQAVALANIYAMGEMKPDAAQMLETALLNEPAAQAAATKFDLNLNDLAGDSAGGDYQYQWDGPLKLVTPPDPVMGRIAMLRRLSVGENKRIVGRSFRGWQLTSEDGTAVALRDPLGISHPIPVEGVTKPDQTQRQVVFNGGLMIAILPGELIAVNLFALRRGDSDPVLWRRAWRTESSGSGFRRRSEATAFGDQMYRYIVSSGGNGTSAAELQLGPIVGDTFYLLQGAELLAIDVATQAVRWRNLEAPRDGAIVCDGDVVAVVSPGSQVVAKYDCRDGRRLADTPFTDFRLWGSTDRAVLIYRDLPDGKRELQLRDPIRNETLLEHTFTDLVNDKRVFGRIVEGRYVTTLSTTGEVLVWDLEQAKVVCDNQVEPTKGLTGLHVLPRHDSLVILPAAVNEQAADAGNMTRVVATGDSHVRVDDRVWAIGLRDGKTLWECDLQDTIWGCTLTQSQVSPIVLLSASNTRFLTTGSRSRSIDVLAIDTRDGTQLASKDLPTEYTNSEIETRLTVQPPQQRVMVNIGSMMLEYYFGERTAGRANEEPQLDDLFGE